MQRITLKAARVNVGLTQESLAKMMGVHRQTISTWEDNPSIMQIKDAKKLCDILGITIDQLIFLNNNSTKC